MAVCQVAALGCEADFNTRVAIGGPDTFTFGEIVALAAEAAGVPRRAAQNHPALAGSGAHGGVELSKLLLRLFDSHTEGYCFKYVCIHNQLRLLIMLGAVAAVLWRRAAPVSRRSPIYA